ncbi:hypothetical protein M3484_03230 [Pseudomonas sp. GX19020]|uniref:hypothetical protein n=1 Tax=Pseudomonas sp. GX19020 TaxID=2942277 RepID=UPI00201985A4|nr:hypothetical protein [Pseudomonas sp. GX19020]MCL4065587.1 hypothetical protein [Pseudomonas sp. GX19020]
MFDINIIRRPILEMSYLPNIDQAYTMHYDETNNIRRLHLTPGGLNVRSPQCFVLGGVAHRGAAPELSFEDLRTTFYLQKSSLEMKLEHLGKGDFPAILKSHKVVALLEWLFAQDLFVHFQVLDPLYWSIVDIIDSILVEKGEPRLFMLAPHLKSDLYKVLRYDEQSTSAFLHRYDYPDVGAVRRVAFIEELLDFLEPHRGLLGSFRYQNLKGIIQYGRKLESLPFLEGEASKILIDGFQGLLCRAMLIFTRNCPGQAYNFHRDLTHVTLPPSAVSDGGHWSDPHGTFERHSSSCAAREAADP